jgi:hypothetical protein
MKKLLLASVLSIASFPGYVHAAEGIEEGVPCHDFSGAAHDRCAKSVTYCQRNSGYREPFQDEKAKASYYACIAKQPDPETQFSEIAESRKDYCVRQCGQDGEALENREEQACYNHCIAEPPARVTVQPPYQGPPPIGWVYAPYTQCANPPQCSVGVVTVDASGLNVRVTPNRPPVMALVNGVPLYPMGRQGDWLLVAPACDLTPTWAWSWTAGVPLNRCWVYF